MHRARACKGNLCLLEGPHLLAAALDVGIEPECVLATSEYLRSGADSELLSRLASPPDEVEPRLLDELADADSPRGLVALAEVPRDGDPDAFRGAERVLYVDGIQDPGNLGALARVAEAVGSTALALAPGTVHPNHPRALRASAGSLLRVPLVRSTSPDELDRRLEDGRRWIGLVPRHGTPLDECELQTPLVLAVGAEGPGLSPELERRCHERVTIPVAPPVESLNVVVAAALVLYASR